VPQEALVARLAEARATSETYPFDPAKLVPRYHAEYMYSWGLRGDNRPEYAQYLGYLLAKDLYPDFKPVPFEDYLKDLLAGKVEGVYKDRVVRID
jgi:hypothetical protein